jgi:hypothetical protein
VKAFTPFTTGGYDGGSPLIDRIISAVGDSFTSLLKAVTNDKLVRATLDNTRDWPVTHALGYVPATWEVVDIDANATVWRSKAVNARASSMILLRASAPVTVLLRFS